MQPDEFIQSRLAHVYDPQKAHEYYLLNRKLKGRKPGEAAPPTGRQPAGAPAKGARPTAVAQPKAAPVKGTRVAASRQAALGERLVKLQSILDSLKKQRAALTPEDSSSDKKDDAKSSDKKGGKEKSTAKEKREARERYEKIKDKTPDKSGKSDAEKRAAIDKKIADIREKMTEIREQLQAEAKPAAAAPKSASPTVPKGR